MNKLIGLMVATALLSGCDSSSNETRRAELQIAYANCSGESMVKVMEAASVGRAVEPITIIEECMTRKGGGRKAGQTQAEWWAETQKAFGPK